LFNILTLRTWWRNIENTFNKPSYRGTFPYITFLNYLFFLMLCLQTVAFCDTLCSMARSNNGHPCLKTEESSYIETCSCKNTVIPRVTRWYIFKQKFQIWVIFGGSCNARCRYIWQTFSIF
jgi:hypothetical protein